MTETLPGVRTLDVFRCDGCGLSDFGPVSDGKRHILCPQRGTIRRRQEAHIELSDDTALNWLAEAVAKRWPEQGGEPMSFSAYRLERCLAAILTPEGS